MRRSSRSLTALLCCSMLAIAAACTQSPAPAPTTVAPAPAAGPTLAAATAAPAALAVAGSGPASVTVVYTCSGLTNDQASYDGVPGNNVQSSAQVLALLASTIPNFPANPALAIGIASTVPATAAAGTPYATTFDFSAALPASLVSGAQVLGLSSVTATNATFNVAISGGTPVNLSSFVASQSVALVAGATISRAVTGSVTGSGPVVTYQPGVVTLGLNLNVNVLLTHIDTISVSCIPVAQDLTSTAITSGGTTTTTTTTTTTSTTTTSTVPPTTARPTTTTTSTTTTSTVPPTTARPTTTTTTSTVPKPTTTTTTTTTSTTTTTVPKPTTTTTVPQPTTTTSTTTSTVPKPTTTTSTTTTTVPRPTTTVPPTTVPTGEHHHKRHHHFFHRIWQWIWNVVLRFLSDGM